jgi:hypothetical protein
MRTLQHIAILTFTVLLSFVFRLNAETIIMSDDAIYQGKITHYSNDSLVLETQEGSKKIDITKIRLIDYLASAKKYKQRSTTPSLFIIYLKNGEIIEGIITQFTNEFLTIESSTGYGVLQLPISSVNFITTGTSYIDLNQRNGIGYVQKRATINGSSGLSTYSSNQLSYKFFFENKLFGNILLAYGDASYNGSNTQVMAVDYRLGYLFKKVQNVFLFTGGYVGYLQIKDDSRSVSGSGTEYGAFLGAEMFFPSLPNFGFAGEIGLGIQDVGDYSSTVLSVSSFPSFSIHYYY